MHKVQRTLIKLKGEIKVEDKRVFVENLILRIREIDISFILKNYISLKKVGRNYLALCPFHLDKTLGSFVISPDKGIYKCFSCGEGGDGIKFVSRFKNISYIQASLEIGYNMGLISLEEYEQYSSFKFRKSDSIGLEKTFNPIELQKPQTKRDIKKLNRVYSLFLDLLDLDEEDFIYLTKERKLSEETINKRRYKSCDYSAYMRRKITRELLEKLGESEYSDFLSGVPGFYQEKYQGEYVWTFSSVQGIIIPILDVYGNIAALQVRKKNKEENKSRYVWFSSSFASYEDSIYKGGSSPGSPLDVVFPDKISNNRIFITEGRFKSEQIIRTFNSIAISLQGVSSWRGIDQVIETIISKNKMKNPEIVLSFDADFQKKYSVFSQLEKIAKHIKSKFPTIRISVLLWEYTEKLKGIDDFLLDKEECSSRKIFKIDAFWCINALNGLIKNAMKENNLRNEWEIEPIHLNFSTYVLLESIKRENCPHT